MPTAARPSDDAPQDAPDSAPGASALPLGEALELARPYCARVLARFRIPLSDAEDLAQDAVVLLLRQRATIEQPERWLPRALVHLCQHYWRTRRRRPVESLDVHPEPATEHAGDEARAVARRDLERALAALPPRPRRLLLLRHVEGCSAREVAERLGYSPASVDRIGRRGLAALAKRLGPGGASR